MRVTWPPIASGISTRLDLAPHGLSGRLLVFCGVDGSGKSTALASIRSYLEGRGIPTFATDVLSRECRRLPYFRAYAEDPTTALRGETDLPALCCACLGDRLIRMRTRFLPMLRDGTWLLCDRYVFTPLAELLALGCAEQDIRVVMQIARLFPAPDLGVLADVPAEVAMARIQSRPRDRGKILHEEFYRRTTEMFRQVSRENGLVTLRTDAGQHSILGALRPHLDPLLCPA